VYFATTPGVDQYQGRAEVANRTGRSAIYNHGGMSFSRNTTVAAPVSEMNGEPSSRTDKYGNHYIAGIRGVPAGVDLWYFDLRPNSPTFDPHMRNPIYRGQPDSFTGDDAYSVGADGGGDVDLAVGFGDGPNGGPPVLAFTSLVAANISSARSYDRGATWTLNPLGNVTGGIPADDRQWIEFFGNNTVYLLYRTLAPAVTQIQRSTDGGLTFGPARTAGLIGQVGSIDVDKNDGTVYISGSTGQVAVGIPDPILGEPLTYNVYQVGTDPNGVANIFFVVKVADDGTAYVCYSNGKDIFIKHSTNKGLTWSDPIRVNDGPLTKTSLLPWMETGPVPGSVGVAWYGSPAETNSADAEWRVFYAQTFNAKDDVVSFQQAQVSDNVIHAGVISTGGTLGDANRNILDYFQVSFDPQGAAVVGWTSDHNDFTGFTFVSRQITGKSISNVRLPAQTEGNQLPPLSSGHPEGAQVADFAQDAAIGLLAVVPTNDPLDILWIKYSSHTLSSRVPTIRATMKVSDLSQVGPNMNWRMNFSANAPYAGENPRNQFASGVSDKGDQFYLRAFTDAAGTPAFVWGTAARNPDGSLTYTQRGTATGAIDVASNTVTVEVSAQSLNQFTTRGPIKVGTILSGLRGQAYTSGSGSIKRDSTRGGREFQVVSSDGTRGGR
ncbi:MAG TPA: hypothetical protein VEX38_02875, partial [Fimbriimonadaceae bacterium]|nr:hypothetical protein [Fimbriimonadaceae bacterium]